MKHLAFLFLLVASVAAASFALAGDVVLLRIQLQRFLFVPLASAVTDAWDSPFFAAFALVPMVVLVGLAGLMFNRRGALVALLCMFGLILGACSTAQTDKFIGGLTNFQRGVAAVDETLKTVNTTLYNNCVTFQTVASSIDDIAGSCSKAAPYTSTANAVINGYCQSSQLASNGGIANSIAVTASSISAAKSTLTANKKACAS